MYHTQSLDIINGRLYSYEEVNSKGKVYVRLKLKAILPLEGRPFLFIPWNDCDCIEK